MSSLEDLFGLPEDSTPPMITPVSPVSIPDVSNMFPETIDTETGEITQIEMSESERDNKRDDALVHTQLNSVYEAAIEAYNVQQAFTQQVDPKFSARNAEVAAQFLSIALNATTARSKAKYDRQKMNVLTNMKNGPNQVQNNVIIANRNDILDNLFSPDFEQTIQGQIEKEIKS